MKKAVMYGAGNIGRGFLGALFSQAGYQVTFIDVSEQVIAELNERGEYPVRVIRTDGHEDMMIRNVSAIHGGDRSSAAEAIAQADIMATAVGVNAMKYIASNIAKGVQRRKVINPKPLDIIICENLIGADHALAEMVKSELTEAEKTWTDENIGFVEASIGRMVPVQTDEMKDGDALRVCVEEYCFLPVDKDAFKGDLPDIAGLVPYSPFDYYIKRKLFLHNMGHAVTAYLGGYTGKTYIYEAIADPNVRLIVENAMLENALALSKAFNEPIEQLIRHMQDLLNRFGNRALMDTCARVGGDTCRKLSENDRLCGAVKLCASMDIPPVFISAGIAAALFRHLSENTLTQEWENAALVLNELSGLGSHTGILDIVKPFYEAFASGESVNQILHRADKTRADMTGKMV